MSDKVLLYFLPCLVNIMTAFYLSSRILNKKIDFKKISTYVLILIYVFISIVNYIYISQSFRFITSTISIAIVSVLMFKEKIYKTLSSSIILQMILFVSELASYLVFMGLKIDALLLSTETFFGLLFMNIIISIVGILIFKIRFVTNLCHRFMNYLDKLIGLNKYFLMLFLMVSLNILLIFIYYGKDDLLFVITILIFMFVYAFIVYDLINEKWENMNFKEENKNLIGSLNEYEKMLDYQRVNNHENKNQLLVIKSMVPKKLKDIHEYIDEVIKEKREDNEILYTKAKRIPSGGLQGLVYQKMLVMQENNMIVDLDVSRNIRDFDYSKISPKMNYDICCVIGTILDNAIDESKKVDKKEIFISMYVESDTFCIEISNRFKGSIDINKITEQGYTTKGKGHGYGLTLVKQIISNNHNIYNETSIVKDVFTQIIKIKM